MGLTSVGVIRYAIPPLNFLWNTNSAKIDSLEHLGLTVEEIAKNNY